MENITEKAIVPYNPSTAKVLQKEKYNLFAPIAKNGIVGMAAFNTDHFTVNKDTVFLIDKFVTIIESICGPDCNIDDPAEDSLVWALGIIFDIINEEFGKVETEISTLYNRIRTNSSDIDVIEQRLDFLEEVLRIVEEILNTGVPMLEDVDARVKKIETAQLSALLYEGELSIRSVVKGETSYSSGVYAEAVIVNDGGTDA